MNDRPSPDEWVREFKEFIDAESVEPPHGLTDAVRGHVRSDLNPSVWATFLKLVLIHVVVGSLTLLFCPQFGISPLKGAGLMGIFNRFGDFACMLGCGVVFMSGSLLMASFVLRPEEIRVIRKTEILQVTALALLSVGTFICLGSTVVGGLALIWATGSIFGGLGGFELGWVLRQKLQWG